MKSEYILFIDSGIGGLSTLAETMKILPANYIYYADIKHAPYGLKSKQTLLEFLTCIINDLRKKHNIRIIVLACNTATACCVKNLRKIYRNIQIIGTEPALKLATDHNFSKILAITTPATAKQEKFLELKASLNKNIKVIPMQTLATDIEEHYTTKSYFSHIKLLKDLCFIARHAKPFDCVVLGCTHYVFIKEQLANLIKKPMIDGNFGVAKRVKSFADAKIINSEKPSVIIKSSKSSNFAKQNYKKILSQILANLQNLC